jgi:hypothetical protein
VLKATAVVVFAFVVGIIVGNGMDKLDGTNPPVSCVDIPDPPR